MCCQVRKNRLGRGGRNPNSRSGCKKKSGRPGREKRRGKGPIGPIGSNDPKEAPKGLTGRKGDRSGGAVKGQGILAGRRCGNPEKIPSLRKRVFDDAGGRPEDGVLGGAGPQHKRPAGPEERGFEGKEKKSGGAQDRGGLAGGGRSAEREGSFGLLKGEKSLDCGGKGMDGGGREKGKKVSEKEVLRDCGLASTREDGRGGGGKESPKHLPKRKAESVYGGRKKRPPGRGGGEDGARKKPGCVGSPGGIMWEKKVGGKGSRGEKLERFQIHKR